MSRHAARTVTPGALVAHFGADAHPAITQMYWPGAGWRSVTRAAQATVEQVAGLAARGVTRVAVQTADGRRADFNTADLGSVTR